jgi:hypothetical protein
VTGLIETADRRAQLLASLEYNVSLLVGTDLYANDEPQDDLL